MSLNGRYKESNTISYSMHRNAKPPVTNTALATNYYNHIMKNLHFLYLFRNDDSLLLRNHFVPWAVGGYMQLQDVIVVVMFAQQRLLKHLFFFPIANPCLNMILDSINQI